MGSPQEPTKTQYQLLEMAGKLAKFEEPRLVAVSGGEAAVGVTLHRQAVSLSVLEW